MFPNTLPISLFGNCVGGEAEVKGWTVTGSEGGPMSPSLNGVAIAIGTGCSTGPEGEYGRNILVWMMGNGRRGGKGTTFIGGGSTGSSPSKGGWQGDAVNLLIKSSNKQPLIKEKYLFIKGGMKKGEHTRTHQYIYQIHTHLSVCIYVILLYHMEEKLGGKNFNEFGKSVKICQSFFANH